MDSIGQHGRHVERLPGSVRRRMTAASSKGAIARGSMECVAKRDRLAGTSFSAPIRIKDNAFLPLPIGTLSEALAAIQRLPPDKQQVRRWQTASKTLIAAADRPKDAALVEVAAASLRRALLEEGWLY